MRASGDRGRGRPRVASSRASGPREMGHAARRAGRKKERGEKRGEIRGGRTRRVALDGKKMGRELKSCVGLFRRNSGDSGSGFKGESSSTIKKTVLAHDLI